MRARWILLLTVLCGFGLPGCGGFDIPAAKDAQGPPPPPPAPPPPPLRMGEEITFSIADWLTKPRAELAALCDDWTTRIEVLEQAHREDKLLFTLLPDAHFPKATPIFREAKFSAKTGFSLPSYAKEGTHDNDLALHLAKFGDVEAARHLAEPGAADVRARIESLACGKNYPLEWTRLVSLVFYSAQVRLAAGELEGATELIQVHKQLRQALDPKALNGTLGATLLPRGRLALKQALAAWKTAKQDILVQQTTAALASWGDSPTPSPSFAAGVSLGETSRFLGSPPNGHAITVMAPLRALDLWQVPLPADGLSTVVVCCDAADRLAEVSFFYRPRTSIIFPRPGDIAFLWEEAGASSEENTKATGLIAKNYVFGETVAEVDLIPQSNYLGAWVRLYGKSGHATATLPRDLGLVHLDRSFEQNRLRLAPSQRAASVTAAQENLLKQIKPALSGLKAAEAMLQRAPQNDTVASVTVAYRPEEGSTPPLGQLAQPLWAAFGPARLTTDVGEHGGEFLLRWEDASTGYLLQLPFADGAEARLIAQDRHTDTQAFAEQVAAYDRGERQARFAAGKPWVRLPRSVEVAWTTRPLVLQLGMSKAEVVQAIPAGPNVFKRDFPGGLTVAFAGAPARPQPFLPGQVFVRFDANDRVAELRAIYVGGAINAPGAGWTKNVVAALKKPGGAPLESPAANTAWSDMPPQKPAGVLNEWRDDVTRITCRCDPSGAEVVFRACSEQYADGVQLPAFDQLPRGVDLCKLGEARAEIWRRNNVSQPTTTADGALVLSPPKNSPYDALLVWFDNDRVVRVIARHAVARSTAAQPAQMSQQLVDAWGRDFPDVGWPQRREHFSGDVLQALGWHDDRSRVRLFWEETNDSGLRLFTEWRTLAH